MDQDTPPEKVEVKGARTDSIAGIEKRKPRGALLTGNGQIIIGLYIGRDVEEESIRVILGIVIRERWKEEFYRLSIGAVERWNRVNGI